MKKVEFMSNLIFLLCRHLIIHCPRAKQSFSKTKPKKRANKKKENKNKSKKKNKNANKQH